MSANNTKLGIVYHKDYLIHTQGHHPERKERLEHITSALENRGISEKLTMIDPVPASVDDIALVHDSGYIKTIEEACNSGQRNLDMDTYIVPESYRVALLSAGGVLTGLRGVMGIGPDIVFALNRPPGHHAERSRAMGFCLFNNVAVAAEVAKRDYGLKRIAIVDWDVHHGNGTQHTFSTEKEVLFFSVHQSPAFPGTGSNRETGRDQGEGYTINVPLPAGCGDEDYMAVFDEILLPVLHEFQPELILLSAGQDAYHRDPLAGMNLTGRGYYQMAQKLADIADEYAAGRLLACLEGGYHLDGQAGAVLQAMNAFGKWNLPIPHESAGNYDGEMAGRRIREVKEMHQKFWTSLQ